MRCFYFKPQYLPRYYIVLHVCVDFILGYSICLRTGCLLREPVHILDNWKHLTDDVSFTKTNGVPYLYTVHDATCITGYHDMQ